MKMKMDKDDVTMPKISAVINTRNEEQNIRYCLESVKWCDEIIVVDMESEDKTVEIAREYTDKIFSHKKIVAFDQARKFAVEKASGDWILLIDADEMVPKILSEKLKMIAEGNTTDIVYIPFKTYMMGEWIKHTGWWPEYHPRFFKRDSLIFSDALHAYASEAVSARKINLPKEEINAIVHFNYRDSAHFVSKLNRYTTIEAHQMQLNGRKFSLLRMVVAGFRGFQVRYFSRQGYRDGFRGFFLSMFMGFYRSLVYVKLWEIINYEVKPEDKYRQIGNEILNEYHNKK